MGEPIYKQIEKYLKDLITSGKIEPGELLPSENKISEMFNVTRMTVRSAYANLVKEGYIIRKRGIGSIVCKNKISDDISIINSYTKEMISKGYKITTRLISLSIIPADDFIKEKLKVGKEENIWEIKRVRCAEESPVSFMITYMPVRMFPNLKQKDCESLYRYIEECGFDICSADRSVEAKIAGEYLQELLELDCEVPLLHIEQVSYLSTGEIFEYSHSFHYGYRLTFNAEKIKG